MPNIQPEINAFNSAVYGKDVRTAIVNLANKLNSDLDTALEQEFVEVDPTLTISGQGADAAVVGDKLIAYKNLDPADYNNKFANVNTSCLSAKNSNFSDLPGSGEYVLLNARYSYNYNVQFALGYAAADKNFYWRIVNRNEHTVFVDWTTDNTDLNDLSIGNTLSMDRDPTAEIGAKSATLGAGCSATDEGAFAHGLISHATGIYAHAEGNGSLASGAYSHSEGHGAESRGVFSHAEGKETIAASDYQHVEGKHNIADSNSLYAHILGNGTGYSSRSNAYTIDWDGNGWYAGTVKIGGTSYADAAEVATKTYVDSAISAAISSAIGGSY
jgi:hypothetical protein